MTDEQAERCTLTPVDRDRLLRLPSLVVTVTPPQDGPFVVFDCGSISPSLVEAELFGNVKGAFTGADKPRAGLIEEANGGTLFLDEIGELPLDLQPKLLRALEARQTRRLGANDWPPPEGTSLELIEPVP